jgi:hypothetical protein
VLVEGELVDALDLPALDLGCELEDRHPVGGVLELVHVVKAAADPEHLLGCSQDGDDLSPALIRLEDERAPEHRILAEQLVNPIEVALLDRGAEAIRQHRRRVTPRIGSADATQDAGHRRRRRRVPRRDP